MSSSKDFTNPTDSNLDPGLPTKKRKVDKDNNAELDVALTTWVYGTLDKMPEVGPIKRIVKQYAETFAEIKPVFPVL